LAEKVAWNLCQNYSEQSGFSSLG